MDAYAQTVLAAVVSSHLMVDFWFQGDSDAAAKRRLLPAVFLKHAAMQALAAYVFVGGVLVGVLVEPLLREMRSARQPHEISTDHRGLEKGGKYIGQLERALILLFVLSAQPTGVGFLVAAKSIFRFGEVKDNAMRMEAEYIIIGTLLSFAWALAIAWLTQWAMGAI